MVAPRGFLNHVLAPCTLTVVQSVLEEVELVGVAVALVFLEGALRAVDPLAGVAPGVGDHHLVVPGLGHLQVAVTLLVGTQFAVRVLQRLRVLLELLVLLPGIEGQFRVEPGVLVEDFTALFVRALYALEDADFVNDVLVEAGGAELMVALGH